MNAIDASDIIECDYERSESVFKSDDDAAIEDGYILEGGGNYKNESAVISDNGKGSYLEMTDSERQLHIDNETKSATTAAIVLVSETGLC